MADTNRTTYGKTALIDEVTANTQGYNRRQVGEIVDAVFDTIQRQVQNGGRVTIPGFGTWQQSSRAARTGTNIRTKEKIQIPASRSVRWTPGAEFKNAVSGRPTARSSTRNNATSRRDGQGSYAKERGRS
jgi:DNA-binding protein HU-beta